MLISIQSGGDWSDAGYSILECSLSEEEINKKHEEWRKLYIEANKADEGHWASAVKAENTPTLHYSMRVLRPPGGYTRCDGYTKIGSFDSWLVKNGYAKQVDVPVWDDYAY